MKTAKLFQNGQSQAVRLPKEFRSVFDLVGGVRNLVPDDRVQIVESDPTTNHADVGVEGEDQVTTEIAPSNAYVADDTDQTPAWNQNAVDVSPHLFQLE